MEINNINEKESLIVKFDKNFTNKKVHTAFKSG